VTFYSELFEIFEKRKIRYLVVGGVAVVLHGFLRATADLDLMIALDSENLKKFLDLMKELGYKPRVPVALQDFASPDIRRSWIKDKNMKVFSLIHPKELTHLLDVFVDEPIPFEEAYQRRERISAGSSKVNVACMTDLIHLKEKAGRQQDKADIQALKKLLKKKKHG
jgi:predicted nucleotidyltransferase